MRPTFVPPLPPEVCRGCADDSVPLSAGRVCDDCSSRCDSCASLTGMLTARLCRGCLPPALMPLTVLAVPDSAGMRPWRPLEACFGRPGPKDALRGYLLLIMASNGHSGAICLPPVPGAASLW